MPSKSILEQKQAIVADLAEQLKNSPAGVVVNYQGITVDADTKMRKALRDAGVKYMVMKNSLTGRACDEVGLGDMKQYLTGMTAIAIGTTDPVAPAKVLKEYADKVSSFEIKCGFIDGAVINADEVKALASVPSKPILVGKMLGTMMSPVSKLAICLQQIIDKQSDGAEAPAEAPAAEAAAE